MRTRLGLVTSRSNHRRGNFIPRAFSVTIFKMAVVCIEHFGNEGEGGGSRRERNCLVLDTQWPRPELEPVSKRKPFVHFPSRSARTTFASNVLFVSYRVQL